MKLKIFSKQDLKTIQNQLLHKIQFKIKQIQFSKKYETEFFSKKAKKIPENQNLHIIPFKM